MISFINLFFVPMISVYIYYKRNRRKMMPDLDFISLYCVFTSILFLCTKVFSKIANTVYKHTLQPDRALYTAFSVVIAAVLPIVFEFIQIYFHLTIKGKEAKDENKDR